MYPLTDTKETAGTNNWEEASWTVEADPTGLLRDKNTDLKVSYLFWEGKSGRWLGESDVERSRC